MVVISLPKTTKQTQKKKKKKKKKNEIWPCSKQPQRTYHTRFTALRQSALKTTGRKLHLNVTAKQTFLYCAVYGCGGRNRCFVHTSASMQYHAPRKSRGITRVASYWYGYKWIKHRGVEKLNMIATLIPIKHIAIWIRINRTLYSVVAYVGN